MTEIAKADILEAQPDATRFHAPLSDDDYGMIVVYAADLPPDLDLDNETVVLRHLIQERLRASDASALLPHIIAKARELRGRYCLASIAMAAERVGLGVCLIALSFFGCLAGAGGAHAESVADTPLVSLDATDLAWLALGLIIAVILSTPPPRWLHRRNTSAPRPPYHASRSATLAAGRHFTTCSRAITSAVERGDFETALNSLQDLLDYEIDPAAPEFWHGHQVVVAMASLRLIMNAWREQHAEQA